MALYASLLGSDLIITSAEFGKLGNDELEALTKKHPKIKATIRNYGHAIDSVWHLPQAEYTKIMADGSVKSLTPREFGEMLLEKRENYRIALARPMPNTQLMVEKADMEPEDNTVYAREDNRKMQKNGFVRHRVVEEGQQDADDDRERGD